jgi:tellurite resistance protein
MSVHRPVFEDADESEQQAIQVPAPVRAYVPARAHHDLRRVALFEAVVEMAFLVSTAEGPLSADATSAFQSVISEVYFSAPDFDGDRIVQALGHMRRGQRTRREEDARAHKQADDQAVCLLVDLEQQLTEDGPEKRAQWVTRTLQHADEQREALRVAALMAQFFGPPSARGRQALERFARSFSLDPTAVDRALREAEQAIRDTPE